MCRSSLDGASAGSLDGEKQGINRTANQRRETAESEKDGPAKRQLDAGIGAGHRIDGYQDWIAGQRMKWIARDGPSPGS